MTKIHLRKLFSGGDRFLAIPACLMLGLLLSACGSSEQAQAPQPEVAAQPSKPTNTTAETSSVLANMVKAVPVAAGAHPVELRFDLPQKPSLDEPFDMTLNVLGLADASSVELQVKTGSSLEVVAGGTASMGALKTGESARHTLRLRGAAAGISVVDVQLVATVDGSPDATAFAIPVAFAGASDAAAVK